MEGGGGRGGGGPRLVGPGFSQICSASKPSSLEPQGEALESEATERDGAEQGEAGEGRSGCSPALGLSPPAGGPELATPLPAPQSPPV